MNACTIIARNYLAQARVLAASFYEHHPSGTFTVLVLDRTPVGGERFRVLTPTDAGLDESEYLRMAGIYDVMELATAVKPWFLQHLLEESGAPVLYLDPDIELFGPLDELSSLAAEHRLVLTPHRTHPRRYEPMGVAQTAIRVAGTFNLGFLGVGPGNDRFFDWWSQRLARDCVVAPSLGLFVDQRWFDFVPGFFEHTVVSDPAVNVAWWNLDSRMLRTSGKAYEVDGRPLIFFHFSGYDPREPHLLSKHQGPEPRILLSENPELRALCDAYAVKLEAAGFPAHALEPYEFDILPGGPVYDRRMRRLYRSALLEFERSRGEEPPNPFAEPDDFVGWLAEPSDPIGEASRISRYLQVVYEETPELQRRFSDLRWLDGDSYLDWASAQGRLVERIPGEVVGQVATGDGAPAADPPAELARGVNLVGYLQAEAGVGEAARQLAAAVRHAGIPSSTLTYRETQSRQEHEHEGDERDGIHPYDTNVICVNADQLPSFAYDAGPDFFAGRYSIGVWWWEVAEFPEWLHEAFDLVHEVWVGSEHVARAVRAETTKPVYVFPLPVEVPPAAPLDRAALGLPDGFLFLFSFDFLSVFERKNPLELIAAFRQAFRPGEGPILVLKSINGEKRLGELEQLRAAASEHPDVIVLDRYVSVEEKNALAAGCDCYVSLHRSEGFGLTLAEAMAYGRPVIATAYSGNLEFMDDENSYLVRAGEGRIPEGADPYPGGGVWAEPDLDEAARLMRSVYEQPEEARERGRLGQEAIREDHSLDRAAEFVQSRFAEIDELRPEGTLPARPDERAPEISEIDEAKRFLAEGPSLPIRAPSRFGQIGVFARRLVFRTLRPYMMRQREWELAVVESLRKLEQEAFAVREAGRSTERRLTKQLADAIDELERLRRSSAASAIDLQAVDEKLHHRIYTADPEALMTTDPRGRPAIGYSGGGGASDVYVGFEDVFRGPEELVRDRQRIYVELLRVHETVLDVGCGRGELLDLLRDAGVEARGVDIDEGMVARARAKGHKVELADANAYLAGVPDGSLGAIFSAQLIEHLPYEDLEQFLRLAHAKLRPDGLLVAETVNPYAVNALRAFWVDLTHRVPIYPEVAVVLCRLTGFDKAWILWPMGSGNLEQDRRDRGEYAVVATRGGRG